MPEEILELSALAPERRKAHVRWEEKTDAGTVERDEVFELASPDDFGAATLARIGQLYTETETLLGSTKRLTRAQEKRLESALNSLACLLIREAPREVVERLPAAQKRQVSMAFFVRGGLQFRDALGETAFASLSGSSPPASNGSTEDTL